MAICVPSGLNATLRIVRKPQSIVRVTLPVDVSHSSTLDEQAAAICLPSGLNATLETLAPCPSVRTSLCVATFQIFTSPLRISLKLPPPQPTASCRPSGLKATLITPPRQHFSIPSARGLIVHWKTQIRAGSLQQGIRYYQRLAKKNANHLASSYVSLRGFGSSASDGSPHFLAQVRIRIRPVKLQVRQRRLASGLLG